MQVSYVKDDIAFRDYDDIVVVYNLKNGAIITLENVAADIWRYLSSGVHATVNSIAENIAEIYDCRFEDVVDDIAQFVDELYSSGIVQINGNYYITEGANPSTEDSSDLEGEIIQLMGKRGQLFSATLELTYACNEKCIHCYANYPENDSVHLTVTKAEYLRVIDELYELGCLHLSFTGGDPFMYSDFLDVYNYARDKGFVCDIYTNGLYIADHPSVLDDMTKRNPRVFYISLYGATAFTHDRVTTIEGSFEKTIAAIKSLTERKIPVVLNVMLLNTNYTEAQDIIELANTLGVQYRVGMSLIYKNDGSNQPMNYFINDKEKIKSVLKFINKNLYTFDQDVLNIQKGELICGAGSSSVSVSPEGKVYPCISLKVLLGDIHTETMDDIWNSDKRKQLVDSLRWENTTNCNQCDFYQYCPHCIGISEGETGDLFSCNTCDRMLAECICEMKGADEKE